MHYLLLATDYDGTLAHDGVVNDNTLSALDRFRASGRKLAMVTGRHLPDLCNVFPHLDLFDRVVVENGGVLYHPRSREEKLLSDPPNQRFIELLKERKVPFSAGRTVVATWRPHDGAVLAAIRDLGLDLQVIFNKESVMVLPSGVNKGTGLHAALQELGISAHNVVAVGDAENDLPMFRMSGCRAAVANALPSLKEEADLVLEKPRGEGVTNLMEFLIADDLAQFDANLQRHSISLGQKLDEAASSTGDRDLWISPRGATLLVAGPSASGKSTMIAGILEQFVDKEYQFCLIDPEGDYDAFTDALSFGNPKETPDQKALLRALDSPEQSAIVNLMGVALDDRAGFFSGLLPQIQDLRTRAARPHWLIIDEAHHMLPCSWSPANATIPQLLESTIMITVHPEHVAKAALNVVDVVVAIGNTDAISSYASIFGIQRSLGITEIAQGEALVWFPKTGRRPVRVKAPKSARERLRHVRQYAEGELSANQSFYFRGPESKLNLRAQNLKTFLQLADGVDDDTWMYHLRQGDYSNWFESIIKDQELKRQAAEIERDMNASARDSRERIRQAVEARYTAPA